MQLEKESRSECDTYRLLMDFEAMVRPRAVWKVFPKKPLCLVPDFLFLMKRERS